MRKVMSLAAFALLMSASMTLAAEVEVRMLNKGADGLMVFEPSLIKIEPGDTVRFVASDKSHNAETIKGMLPEGATPFAGKMNEDVVVTFDNPGAYGIKCMPHYAMGMVALVVVGKPDNLDQAKAVPQTGKAKQIFATLFDRLSQQAAVKGVRQRQPPNQPLPAAFRGIARIAAGLCLPAAFGRFSCWARCRRGWLSWCGCRFSMAS